MARHIELVGAGTGGDPLRPLRHRPQLALATSIVNTLQSLGITIPPHGPITDADCHRLPLEILAVLADCPGLLPKGNHHD